MNTSNTRRGWSALAAMVFLSGCDATTQAAIRQVQQAASQAQQTQQNSSPPASSSSAILANATLPTLTSTEKSAIAEAQAQAASWASQWQKKLKPVTAGNGVAVFEPNISSAANASTSTPTRDFGAGCARWLQLHVGGQGELGRTPLWGALADAQKEFRLPSLRLRDAEAVRVAKSIHATHAVVGTVAGNEKASVFTLRVLDLRGKAVGTPIVVAGTSSKIIQQLPTVARQIAARLDVENASITTTALTPDDMTFLGSVPRKSRFGNLNFSQELRLRQTSSRDALPGVMWLYNDARDETRLYRQVVGNMLSRSRSNVLVWATIGWRAPRLLKPEEKSFESVLKRYPNNSVLALSESNYRLSELDEQAQMQATMRAISVLPKLEMGWAQLSSIYSQQAYKIRGARYSGDMTAAESARVQQLYPQAFSAAIHAASLNPETSYSWLQAAESATFDGNSLATALLWQAMRADPDDTEVHSWGLQMFQPKWGGDTNSLRKVVAAASSNAQVLPWLVDDIKMSYDASGIGGEFASIPPRAVSLLQKEVAKKPDNAFNRGQLATLLTSTHQPQKAIAQLQQCAKLWPDSANPLLRIAATYADPMRSYANADKWYSAALAKEPNNSSTLLEVANYYKNERRNFEKSAPLFRRAIKLEATNLNAVVGLANVTWFLKNDKKNGGALFQKAVAMPQNDGSANEEYAWALMRTGQNDAAVAQAKKALKRGRYGHPVFKELGLQ